MSHSESTEYRPEAAGYGRGIASLLTFLLCLASATAQSAVIQANPSNYRSLIGGLGPGDTLVLAPGAYAGLTISGKHGAPGNPIIITGPESGEPAVITGRACCNTIQIENSSHVEVRHLTVDALGIDGIDGVNGRGVTHYITIAHLRFLRHDFDQQTNAISTKGPAWNWTIRDNVIDGAGTGIYLGDSNGGQPFVNGIIERNLIFNTIGYNMQIKHQNPRPTNLGMPSGDSRTIIRHNVFSKSAGNSSTGGNARPNLLVGHFPLSGAGVNDIYEIYGNFFYQNPTEALFQGEGNIAMYSNLMVNDFGSAIHVQPHNDVPRRVLIFRNTIVASGNGIRVSGGAAGYERRVAGNAVFAATPISAPDNSANVTGPRSSAPNFLVAPFAAPGALDLYPRDGALGGAAFDTAFLQGLTDAGLDFDGRAQPAGQRGAYAADAGGPAWPLVLAIKGSGATGQNPDSDPDPDPGPDPDPVPPPEYKPELSAPGNQPSGAASVPGPAYAGADGRSLAASWWQVFDVGNNRQVYGRRLAARQDLRLPVGVLDAGRSYRVRVRHENDLQQLSAWSDFRQFAAEQWNDADNDGTHDFYQDGTQVVDDRCRLRHPSGGALEMMTLTPSSRIRCRTLTEAAEVAAATGVTFTANNAAPYGFAAFRVDGLPVGGATPAALSVLLDLPRELDGGGSWYEFDRAAGALTNATPHVTGLAAGSRQVMVSFVDGGRGDADGVVNGSIVAEGGLVISGVTGGTGGVQTGGPSGDDGGAGAAGPVEALLLSVALCWLCAASARRG